MLTEYFSRNLIDLDARLLFYRSFPQCYVWNKRGKLWEIRKKCASIGKIVTVNLTEDEQYYLKLLLNHVKGATSFEDLKTVNSTLVSSFRESTLLLGLLQDDDYISHCLEEVTAFQMSYVLRRLFTTILVYCHPNNLKLLWTTHYHSLSEDYRQMSLTPAVMKIKVLQHIHSILEGMGKSITDYDLVTFDLLDESPSHASQELEEESNITVKAEDLSSIQLLNEEQRRAYDTITYRIFHNILGAFFVDGPGGSGKTFLYRVLLASVRSKGFITLTTASSGVATSILPGGRTAHSRFKIPLEVDKTASCSISKQSSTAKLLKLARLIIWDEAHMCRKDLIEAFYRMLQDLHENESPFGGKDVILGGDFRQVLPVVHRGNQNTIIEAPLLPLIYG